VSLEGRGALALGPCATRPDAPGRARGNRPQQGSAIGTERSRRNGLIVLGSPVRNSRLKLAAASRRGPLTIRGCTDQDRKHSTGPRPRFAPPAGPDSTVTSPAPRYTSFCRHSASDLSAALHRDFRAFFAHAPSPAGSFSAVEKSSTKVVAPMAVKVDEANTSGDRFDVVAVPATLVPDPSTLFTESGSVLAGSLAGDRPPLSGRRSDP
jgi:hypothetical protein